MTSSPARPALPLDVDPHDLHTLHGLLDLLHRDVAVLLVVEVVWFKEWHRVIGRLAGASETVVPFAPVIIRCGPGARTLRSGMRLRLSRDHDGVSLEGCIP